MSLNWDEFPNFTETEFRCRCGCGRADMDVDFVTTLQALRTALGVPMRVTSGFRCEKYDKEIGGAGVHPSGQAVDFLLAGDPVFQLIDMAQYYGFIGIGLKQHGPWESRYVHLDQLISDDHPRPRIWTYG